MVGALSGADSDAWVGACEVVGTFHRAGAAAAGGGLAELSLVGGGVHFFPVLCNWGFAGAASCAACSNLFFKEEADWFDGNSVDLF